MIPCEAVRGRGVMSVAQHSYCLSPSLIFLLCNLQRRPLNNLPAFCLLRLSMDLMMARTIATYPATFGAMC